MRTTLILICAALAMVASGASRRGLLATKGSSTIPPAFVAYTTNTFNATSDTIAVPTGTVAGGVLKYTMVSDTDHAINSYPAGFTEVLHNTSGATGYTLAVKATDGTESGSLVFGFAATELGVSKLEFYSGCTTNFSAGVSSSTSAPGGGVAMTSSSLNPGVNNCIVAADFYTDPAGVPTFTAVGGYTFTGDATRSANAALGSTCVLQSTATAQTQQLIASEGGTWGTSSISFKPYP